LALRMMAPGFRFNPRFSRQFVLGGRHFRAADPRLSVFPKPFTDEELSSIHAPVLLLVGDRESTFDPKRALAQAQRCIASVRAELVPGGGRPGQRTHPSISP
jgi:pimeloyl-ACP methyl ester carboxylesterase